MILAYAVVFVILYVVIYVVPQVSGIFVETYTAEYGILEVSQNSSFIAVRNEKLYVSDNSGAVSRAAAAGKLVRRNSHIADVGSTRYYCQKRGLVSYFYDGLEEVYTPENMQTITEKNLELSDEEKQSYEVKECSEGSVQRGVPIFKIVDNNDWYLVCWIDSAEAESWKEGSSITVEFEDTTRVKMKISQKNRQGQKVYAVGVFQHIHVVILYAVLYGDGHAHRAAGGRAHPQHVVVAPLYVHAVVAHEVVQNYVGVGAAVEYVADYVQCIHGHALYEGAQLRYERIRHAGVYYGADYVVVIGMFVVLVLGIEKLLHYVGKVLRQSLAHLGAGVF